ncbi:MAG: glycosyltransferase family 4 protein [Arcobacteraceae bacterium]|nr:glycosyltransferase family 4 protein [Arcobacteraceae bacterium]
MKKKIVHLTSVHARHDIRILLKECSSLVKAGYDVSLVVADGLGNEEKNGVKIHDVGKQNGRINRILNTTKNVFKKCVELNADLYHFHDPELIPIGVKLKKLKKKVIFDSHEDFASDILTKDYIPRVLRFFISSAFKIYDSISCKKFDVIVTATKAISEIYKNRGCKTVIINNYPILDELNTSVNLEKEKICCFTGAQNQIRGIKELVTASEQIDGKLYLAGPKTEAFEKDLKLLNGWKNVIDLGNLSRHEVANLLAKSSVGLVTYLPAPNHVDSQPNKLFEYMSVGIPVIASNFPLWREIVVDNNCGLCIDPTNPQEITDAINYFFYNNSKSLEMGINGKKAVQNIYNWNPEEVKLISLYKELMQ